MAQNSGAVYAGMGQDPVTGTVLSAPFGTPLPVTTQAFFEAVLDVGFLDNGYVGEKGVTLSTGRKFFDVKDMDGQLIDSVQNAFDGNLKATFLELNQNVLTNMHGPANVVATAATTTAGNRLALTITGEDLDPQSYIFRMKNGKKRVGIIVPKAKLTDQGDIVFNANGTAMCDVTIKTIPYYVAAISKTVNAYVITDDGIWVLSLVPTITSVTPSAVSVGNEFTVFGTRFTGTTAVTVGGVSVGAGKFNVISDGILGCVMPAGSAGSAPVIVTNATGASSAFAYTRGA